MVQEKLKVLARAFVRASVPGCGSASEGQREHKAERERDQNSGREAVQEETNRTLSPLKKQDHASVNLRLVMAR